MTTSVSTRKVPHVGPTDAEVFLVGEAPGRDEDVAQRPFIGQSGDLLNMALDVAGIDRDSCRIGNVLNYQPNKNNFANAHTSWQLEESRRELLQYLKGSSHKIIVPMGNRALEFFTGHESIEKHRGSVYTYGNSLVVPTIHPAAVLRNGSYTSAFLHDLAKVQRILTDGWKEPVFNFVVDPSFEVMEGSILPKLLEAPRLWCDIETKKYTSFIRCMGFAWSGTEAVVIFNDSRGFEPSEYHNGLGPNFSRWLNLILGCKSTKTFHNGFFDTTILAQNGIQVTNWNYDTMLMQHSLQPELPLGLDYCTSMYTDINYYKDDGKDSSDRVPKMTLGTYCAKDVVATCQTELAQREEADEVAWAMFNRKWAQIPLAREVTDCGLPVDMDRRLEVEQAINKSRDRAYTMFFGVQRLFGLASTDFFRVSQHEKVKNFLYNTLELPVKTDKDDHITTNEDALVSLLAHCNYKIQSYKTDKSREPWELRLTALRLILELRGYDKLLTSYVNLTDSKGETRLSPDGRARSVYNITGTETNRWSASEYWDGTGLNGQTIPREVLEVV